MTDSKLILPASHQPRRAPSESAVAKLMQASRQYRQLAAQYNELLEKSQKIMEVNKSLFSERMLMVAKLAELGHEWQEGEEVVEQQGTVQPVEFFSDTPEGITNENRWELDRIAVAAQHLTEAQAKGLKISEADKVTIDGQVYNRTRFVAPPA